MRDEIPYQDIVTRLNDMAETIAADMIPDGKRDGSYWRGDCHGKCSVHIRGGRTGTVGFWQGQRSASNGGNLIHLIEVAMGCASHGEAVRIAKERYLGLGRRELTVEEKRRWAQSQNQARAKAAQREKEETRSQARRQESARDIWHGAKPLAGTPAEIYLRSRAIDLPTWPASLRFHGGLNHVGRRHPALIGGVQSVDRKLIAIWRIFLTPEGRALLVPDHKKVKLGFGPATGGAVRLGPEASTIFVTEGIETGLAVHLLTQGRAPVWAALSTSGMIGLELPTAVERIEIWADADRYRTNERTGAVDKPPGIVAAERLQARARERGIEAVIHQPPEPDDWLDVWQGRRKHEQANGIHGSQ